MAFGFEVAQVVHQSKFLEIYGSFRKLGVPNFGVLIMGILLFRVLYQAPLLRKLPYGFTGFHEMVQDSGFLRFGCRRGFEGILG